jgi:hypothetical protein
VILPRKGCDTVFLVGLNAAGCVLRTLFDAERLGFQPFMIEGALLSHDTGLNRAVEEITGAVRPGNLASMILNAPNWRTGDSLRRRRGRHAHRKRRALSSRDFFTWFGCTLPDESSWSSRS